MKTFYKPKKLFRNVALLFVALLLTGTSVKAQLSGGTTYPINGTQNPPTSFSTIQNAATYLAVSGVTGTGNVVLELQSGYASSAEPSTGIYFDTIANSNLSRRVILRPGTGYTASVSGSVAGAGLINLRATNYLIIDGRQGGSGAIGLTISNTNNTTTDSTSTIRFVNDAANNIIRYCVLQGASKSPNYGGVLFFSKGNVSGTGTGNSNNTIDACSIDGTSNANSLICSNGTVTSPTNENQNDTIRNCKLYDNFNAGVANNSAMYLLNGSSGWVITGNSIYQTSSRTFTVQSPHFGIYCGVNWTSDYHVITNNYIGGSSPNAVGSMQISAGAVVTGYQAISTNFGGAGTTISGNTVRNIYVTYGSSAGSYSNAGIISYMGFNGASGSFRGNTVDSSSFTNTAGSITSNGVYVFTRITTSSSTFAQTISVNANTVRNILISTQGSTLALATAQFHGIRIESTSAASITGGANTLTVSSLDSNTVSNITTDGNGSSTLNRGMYVTTVQGSGSTATLRSVPTTVNNNLVEYIYSNARLHNNFSNPCAVGIQMNPVAATTINVMRNTIRYIRSTNTADTTSFVAGFWGTNGIYNINANRIYDLTTASSGTTSTPSIFGINIRGLNAASTISNNHISLGKNQTSNAQVFGIVNNFSNAVPLTLLNNTVMITGSSLFLPSGAFLRGTEVMAAVTSPIILNNNLFINTRSIAAATPWAMALVGSTTVTGGNNVYVAADSTLMFYYNTGSRLYKNYVDTNATEATSYTAKYGATTNFSLNTSTVNLANLFTPNGYDSLANFIVNTGNVESWLLCGKGVTNTALTTDYYGNTRSTLVSKTISIGAHEFSTATTPPNCYVTRSIAFNDSLGFVFASRTVAQLYWNGTGTLPTSVACKYYSGALHPSYPSGNAGASYWNITGTGGAGYVYNAKILYGGFEKGTITNSNTTTKLAFYNGTFWNYRSASTADTTVFPNNASLATITTLLSSTSAFALTDNVSSLPVKLLSLNATKSGKDITIDWSTASEINNAYFTVERSFDNKLFFPVGDVKGAVNSNETRNYLLVDHGAQSFNQSVIYYRLKQVDVNGQFTYSDVVYVNYNSKTERNISIAPNPFENNLSVSFQSENIALAQVKVYDMSGKLVVEISINTIIGTNTYPLDELANLNMGIYHINFVFNNEVLTYKVIKLKN